jgi:hypothetical protein
MSLTFCRRANLGFQFYGILLAVENSGAVFSADDGKSLKQNLWLWG